MSCPSICLFKQSLNSDKAQTDLQPSLTGIPAYNAACKSIVLRYSDQWKNIIGRLGRWIDWDSNIKTMDREYMEKVWSIFATIYSQGLIYEDFKVMPYSNACTTPLSNFEASSNYQIVNDQTVIVKFKCKSNTTNLLVWTTTPWTLPANQALCVNSNLEYLEVEHNGEHYYVSWSSFSSAQTKKISIADEDFEIGLINT